MGYDILMIPMSAFNLPQTSFSRAMDWVITLFWSMDIILTFFVGFYNLGALEMRLSKIASRYLKSWFAIDILVVSVDWVVMLAGDSSEEGNALGIMRISKSLRIARVLRMFRLLRILKVLSVIEELSDFVHSELLQTCFSIVKLVIGITIVNHFIACGWYAIGSLDLSSFGIYRTWVQEFTERPARKQDGQVPVTPSTGYLYATSLHWSLTQFTPASMSVVACNLVERVYSVLVILLALVMFSSFVSSITSAMTHLRAIKASQTRQQELVRSFIVENQLSLELGNRVHAFIRQHHRMVKMRVHEDHISAFKFMPEGLRIQMHCEMFCNVLLCHPLFRRIHGFDEGGLVQICHCTLSEKSLLGGEELFSLGQRASKMYFVRSGMLDYYHGASEGTSKHVSKNSRVCEMVLWGFWEHVGRLLATTVCDVVSLDSLAFRTITTKRTHLLQRCCYYAQQYVQYFEKAQDEWSDLGDAWEDIDVVQSMVEEAFTDEAGGGGDQLEGL